MIGLNKIGLNQVQLNQLYLNTLCACQKSSGGDGFPRLPGDVTRWSFKGLTNEMMSKNPRLEDADHKGRFLTFKNFAWGGMSGVGGYTQNYNYSAWTLALDRAETTKTGHSFNVTSVTSTVVAFYYQSRSDQEPFTVKSQIVRVSGLTDGQSIKYRTGAKSLLVIESDGIYTLPPFDFAAKGTWYGFVFGKIQESCNITIEQLPLYPGALVFDGVDDYGICENLPILTKEKGYTVVALRHLLGNGGVMLSKRIVNPGSGAFVVDKDNNTVEYSYSFGTATKVSINRNNPFVYQTSNSYMGQAISTGYTEDNSCIIVGAGLIDNSNSRITEYTKCSIHELVILDHDATEEELTKIKNYFIKTYPWLFFDQAWTVVGKSNEDTNRATIANITGNGNNLVLSNFGFAGNSGYGEYVQDFNALNTNNGSLFSVSKTYKKVTATYLAPAVAINYPLYWNNPDIPYVNKAFKLKLSSNISGISALLRFQDTDRSVILEVTLKEGINSIPTLTAAQYESQSKYSPGIVIKNAMSVDDWFTLEQIPDHEGYLVTDGVDDEVKSSSFSMAKDFTVVGEWELLDKDDRQSGLAKSASFYLYSRVNGLAFYCKDWSKPELLNLKSIVAFNSKGVVYDNKWQEYTNNVVGNNPTYDSRFYLGYGNNNYSKVAFKNLATYVGRILSKEDAIKAYIYLQTLKAK